MRRLGMLGAALAMVLATGLSGCAGGDTSAGGSTTAASTDEQTQARRFAECMRENGVNLPDPGPGGGPVKLDDSIDQSKLEQAQQACKQFAPGLSGPGGTTLSQEQLAQLRRFAECMREHGVKDFPDPSPDGGLVVKLGQGGANPDDPTFKAAEKACRQYGPEASAEVQGGGR